MSRYLYCASLIAPVWYEYRLLGFIVVKVRQLSMMYTITPPPTNQALIKVLQGDTYSIPTLKSRTPNYAINDMEVVYRVWPTLVKCERAVNPVQALACAERELTTVVGIGRYDATKKPVTEPANLWPRIGFGELGGQLAMRVNARQFGNPTLVVFTN